MSIGHKLGLTHRGVDGGPGAFATSVILLGIAIGVSTAAFSLVDALLWRPLPYPSADRLEEVWTKQPDGFTRPGISGRVASLLNKDSGFASVGSYAFGSAVLRGPLRTSIVNAPFISPSLLLMLGVRPVRGRLFDSRDITARNAILIGERFWRNELAQDPEVIGRPITLDDAQYEVVGVLPLSFRFPENGSQVWRVLDAASVPRQRVLALGVRDSDVTHDQLLDRLTGHSRSLAEASELRPGQVLTTQVPVQLRFGAVAARQLWLTLAIAAVLFVSASANVAQLQVSRGLARMPEFSIRSALGASGRQLAMLALLDALWIALSAAAVGLVIAQSLLVAAPSILPPQLTFLLAAAPSLDARVLAAEICLTVVLFAGIAALPATHAFRAEPSRLLAGASRSITNGASEHWRLWLMSIQVALVILTVTTGIVLHSNYRSLVAADLGIAVARLSAVDVRYPPFWFKSRQQMQDLTGAIEHSLEERTSASVAVSTPPVSHAEGIATDAGQTPPIQYQAVSQDYFETMEIAIRDGRIFGPADQDVAVISESLARALGWQGGGFKGKLRLSESQPWLRVVGIVGDVFRLDRNGNRHPGTSLYLPYDETYEGHEYSFLLNSSDPRHTAAQANEVLHIVDDRVVPLEISPMSDRVGDWVALQRFLKRAADAISIVAAAVAMFGMYSAISYWLNRREGELGLRIWLGATTGSIALMLVWVVLRIAGIGSILGVAASVAAVQAVRGMLVGFSTLTISTSIVGACAIVVVTLMVGAGIAYAVVYRRLIESAQRLSRA